MAKKYTPHGRDASGFNWSDQPDYSSMKITAEESLSFAKPGVQNAGLRKLKRGQIPLQAELDLHGLTKIEAQQELLSFLQECSQKNYRCVRLIHGKGRTSQHNVPVLKNVVSDWLKQHPSVLAFCSAKANDGGTGAVYVLLKN